jgi:hypothetical protein
MEAASDGEDMTHGEETLTGSRTFVVGTTDTAAAVVSRR